MEAQQGMLKDTIILLKASPGVLAGAPHCLLGLTLGGREEFIVQDLG